MGSIRWAPALAAVVAMSVQAQDRRTGKRWSDMDYGPYMTHSFEAERPSGNIAYKGLRNSLGSEGASMVFDSDLLRWAGFNFKGNDKAQYRWNFNPRTREERDDFDPLISLVEKLSSTNLTIFNEIPDIMDVEQFLRVQSNVAKPRLLVNHGLRLKQTNKIRMGFEDRKCLH